MSLRIDIRILHRVNVHTHNTFFLLCTILLHDICYLIHSAESCEIYVPSMYQCFHVFYICRCFCSFVTGHLYDTQPQLWAVFYMHNGSILSVLCFTLEAHIPHSCGVTWMIFSPHLLVVTNSIIYQKIYSALQPTSYSAHVNESARWGAICTQGSSPPPHKSYWQSWSPKALGLTVHEAWIKWPISSYFIFKM